MSEPAKPVIFVVDDEQSIAMTLSAILNFGGYQGEFFLHPDDALRALKTWTPAVLITDVNMPGMNGVELAIRFTTECPNCKILIFSGNIKMAGLVDLAIAQGYQFRVFPKPVNPREFLTIIKELGI